MQELGGGKFANGTVFGAMAAAVGNMQRSSQGQTVSGSRAGGDGASGDAPLSAEIIGQMSADGYGPPAPFSSIDNAAQAGLAAAAPLSSTYEYGGAVIESGTGGYYATNPVTINDRHNFAFSLEPGVKPVGIYHTHPAGANSLVFSDKDIRMARSLGVRSYIGTYQDNAIRYFDPSSMRPSYLGSGLRRTMYSKGAVLCKSCF